MNQLTTAKKQRSVTVQAASSYSDMLRVIMPRQNGTQAGIEALKASLERSGIK